MDSSDDDMDAEAVEHEEKTLELLRSKKLVIQNPDGTLRCPVSPSRKKQSYAYKDLLQHASAVAVGKRGAEASGKHSAVQKFLQTDLLSLASPPVERVHKVQHEAPKRKETEELLVCPWSVVIYNIDNSQRDVEKNLQIGLGKAEIRDHYADFKPEKVQVFWGPRGHLGMSVLVFGRDFAGLKNAQALEKSFLDKEHGRRDYERNAASGNLGKGFYGWLATSEDFNGRPGHQGAEVGKYLRTYGNLMDIEMADQETKKIQESLIQKLAQTVSEKNEESLSLRTEIEYVRKRAEEERLQLEETFKKELDEVRSLARKSEEEYNQAISDRNLALQEKEAQLRQRDKELQDKESYSATDKQLLETQKLQNRQQQEMIFKHHHLQEQLKADNMKLVRKHAEENKAMAKKVHHMELELAQKQRMEIEKQQLYGLRGILETEKIFGKMSINEDDQGTSDKDTSHERKTIEQLESKIADLQSDVEAHEDTLNVLMTKDRESTDEITEARKLAIQILENFSGKPALSRSIGAALAKARELEANSTKKEIEGTLVVGVKWAGTIDESPWEPAIRKRHKSDPELKTKLEFSKWEERIRDSAFQPFRTVRDEDGDDKWKQVIDPDNEELSALKKEYGEAVYNSVTTALMEIEEYNASGRYPIPIAWIAEKSRVATLKEVIAYLSIVIKALLFVNNPRKKARA